MSCHRIGSVKRRKGSGIICTDDGPLVDSNPDCPNAAEHEPFPTGYVAASIHADELMETHTQEAPCPSCGRWLIWVPKEASS